MSRYVLGIDASNLRTGGGVIHLVELLGAAEPGSHGFNRVVVWGGTRTLGLIEPRRWLDLRTPEALDGGLVKRLLWQRVRLPSELEASGCDLLFAPGGMIAGSFRPVVTMSRNMLPFERVEMRRYGLSLDRIRLELLRRGQIRSFRNADGVIFLSEYARRRTLEIAGPLSGQNRVVPHGVGDQFVSSQRAVRLDESSPVRIVYVSRISPYKHQHRVVEAVAALRREGRDVRLQLVGSAHPKAMKRLRSALSTWDPGGHFVHLTGVVSHAELPAVLRGADVMVFASSCENLPNTLLEGMAAGLPIASSDRGPMPEVLGEAGLYFDPEAADSIAGALRRLVGSPDLRERCAVAAKRRSAEYSWARCAGETFEFLRQILTGTNSYD